MTLLNERLPNFLIAVQFAINNGMDVAVGVVEWLFGFRA